MYIAIDKLVVKDFGKIKQFCRSLLVIIVFEVS